MLMRVLQFLLGAALAVGGGYLAWTQRADASNVFPPGETGLPLILLAGVIGVTSGIVFLVSAVHPRPNQRRVLAERTSREDAALGEADAYYSQRARAAGRDWRSGDITALAPPAPPSEQPPPAAVAPPADLVEPAAPSKPRSLSIPPSSPRPATKPVASADAAANGASAAPPSPFPAQVTLAPLPRAAEPPPAAVPQAPGPAPATAPVAGDPHAAIRVAISEGKLDEADRMLAAARENATGMELALLTALAGDHAAVSGRQSHSKWLWRLALKRFGELGAMDSASAKAVGESLRQLG